MAQHRFQHFQGLRDISLASSAESKFLITRFATVDDVYGSVHLSDSIAAMALTWRAGEQDSGVTVR